MRFNKSEAIIQTEHLRIQSRGIEEFEDELEEILEEE